MKKIISTIIAWVAVTSTVFGVSAQSAVLLDVVSGQVVYQKNSQAQSLFASTTKIMTAIVAIENYDLDTEVEIKAEWTGVEGSSMYLKPGEVLTVRELLHGLMLSSGNDAATALAGLYNGNVADFVTQMNAKAIEIGADRTFFENPSGLDGTHHKTTAEDLAKIGAYAMKNPDFAQIAATKSVKIGQRYFTNHNKLLRLNKNTVGIKTGFTKAAGRCLVSAVTMGGRMYVGVTLNAPDDWNDHLWMYSNYGKAGVSTNVTTGFLGQVYLPNCQVWATLKPESDILLPLVKGEVPELKIIGDRFVYGGTRAGDKYGKLEVWLKGNKVGDTPLLYGETIEYKEIGIVEKIWKMITG